MTQGPGLPFIQGNAEFGDRSPHPTKWCTVPARRAEAGDTLLSVRAPVGETNRANGTVAIGRGVAAIRFHAVTPAFGWHSLNHVKHRLAKLSQGSTFGAISGSVIRDLELLVPPPVEQRVIANVLDAIDEAIERTEALIAVTETLRRALLHELLARGMPGRHAEWKTWPGLGPVPAAWDVSALGALGRWTTGGTPSKLRKDYWQGAIPWISPKDMKVSEIWGATDHISEAGAAAGSALAEPGAILVVVRGMILAHSFPIAVLRVRGAFNQDIRALTCAPGILPEYVVLALEAQRHALVDLATPTTHGTMRVVLDSLLSRPIALPPPDEQADIVAAVATVRDKEGRERDFLDALRSAKSAVGSALLGGRLRVGAPAADDQVG